VVREIMMGGPVTLKPEDTLDLANDFISLGRIRHIPIVDGHRMAGIVTDRDLIGAAAAQIFGLKHKSQSALLKKCADQGSGSSDGRQKDRLRAGGQRGHGGRPSSDNRYFALRREPSVTGHAWNLASEILNLS
jgi:CBS domain